jgi:hypothetical protein
LFPRSTSRTLGPRTTRKLSRSEGQKSKKLAFQGVDAALMLSVCTFI